MAKSKLIVSLILVMAIVMSFGSALADPGTRDWSDDVTDGQLSHSATRTADSAILVDIKSGRILYNKSAYNPRDPASITKIMTALLSIENAELTDTVTISGEIEEKLKGLDPDSSVAGIKIGEIITVQDLIYGLMLESGNDAAVALACHVGGTYDNFIAMMNAKAQEIGMTTTSYANPHGLTDPAHKTSARDMALLAMYAKQYPFFSEVVGTFQYKPQDTNLTSYSTGQGAYYFNTNKLISNDENYSYQYATGIKTGYTNQAESTLVSSAEYDGQSLVAVVLKDEKLDKWTNSALMFDYGFDFYDTINIGDLFYNKELTAYVDGADLATTGDELKITVGEGDAEYLTEITEKIAQIKADPTAYFKEETNYNSQPLQAPIASGQQVGTVTYTYNYSHNTSEYLGYKAQEGDVQYFTYTAPLYAKNAIDALVVETPAPENTAEPNSTLPPHGGGMDMGDFALYAIVVLFVILVALIIILIVYRSRSESRYRQAQNSRSYDDRGGPGRRRH